MTNPSMSDRSFREVGRWVETTARVGYLAKGIFYAALGLLAVRIALGGGGSTGNAQQQAFQEILQQPFGRILLVLVIAGLLAYAFWRFVQAAVDPDDEGSDASGVVKRVGFAISGVIHLGYVLLGWRTLAGGGGGGGSSAEGWTARLMSQPFGVWLVGITGAIIAVVGLYQFYRAYSAKFQRKLKLNEMSSPERTWSRRIGRLGFAARGVVYVLIGGFLVQAAWRSDPSEAGGLGQALGTLLEQPYGAWLLGAVGVGFFAYAVYAVVMMRYRRIDVR